MRICPVEKTIDWMTGCTAYLQMNGEDTYVKAMKVTKYKIYDKYFKDSSRYPESEPFGNSGMYLPCGPSQSGDNINRVIETLHKFTIS